MKLSLLTATSSEYAPVLMEGYGRVYYFNYLRWKHDPSPRALFLGRYRHPNTRNMLMCAINLNYLTESQILKLQRSLRDILGFSRNGYYRYWRARTLGLNDILDTAYRTYRVDAIDEVQGISPETLRYIAEGIVQERATQTDKREPLPPTPIKPAIKPKAKLSPKPEKATPEVPKKPKVAKPPPKAEIEPEEPGKIEEPPEEEVPEVEVPPEEEGEELPPEIEKAEIPPEHPDEDIDIEEHPPEELEEYEEEPTSQRAVRFHGKGRR